MDVLKAKVMDDVFLVLHDKKDPHQMEYPTDVALRDKNAREWFSMVQTCLIHIKKTSMEIKSVTRDDGEPYSKSTITRQNQDVLAESKDVKGESSDRDASPTGDQTENETKREAQKNRIKESKHPSDERERKQRKGKGRHTDSKQTQEVEKLEIEIEKIRKENIDLEKKLSNAFIKSNMRKKYDDQELQKHKMEIKQLELDRDKLFNHNIMQDEVCLKLQQKLADTEMEVRKLRQKCSQEEEKCSKLEIVNREITKDRDSFKDRKQHKGKGRHADSAKHTQEIEKLKAEIEKLQKANAELSKSIKYNGEELQKQKTEIKQLGLDKEKLHNDIEMRDEVCLKLHQKLSGTENEVHRLWRKCTQEEEKCSKLEVVVNEITKDRDSFKDKFSKLAGAKLTSGNAHIQDLIDINRPQKLGERYSELYNYEWTDALEELQEEFDEKEAIKKLLEYFKSCSSFCLQKAEEQGLMVLKSVTDAIELTDISIPNGDIDHTDTPAEEEHVESLSPSDSKMLKDLIKAKGTVSLKFVQKRYMIENQKETSLGEKVKDFINRCIEVCWFSSIQDPPISFDWNFQEGSEMDDKFVKDFTKLGTKIDYVVWPVMKLYDGGEVLCKGVVQPFPDRKSKKKK